MKIKVTREFKYINTAALKTKNMPASSIDFYLQDARINYDAVRPTPIRPDANQIIGQCQPNIHISTNCYYGYHEPKSSENAHVGTDYEMVELPFAREAALQQQNTARKRSADDSGYPQSKRPREEVQREPETNKNTRLDTEDLMETLYWNIHGGNIFHMMQNDSPMCSLVGTRSSPSHSASAFNANIPTFYTVYVKYKFLISIF